MQLATYLEKHGLTATAFAGKHGLSKSFICRLVKGTRTASPEMAIRLEVATNKAVSRGDLRPDLWPKRRAA